MDNTRIRKHFSTQLSIPLPTETIFEKVCSIKHRITSSFFYFKYFYFQPFDSLSIYSIVDQLIPRNEKIKIDYLKSQIDFSLFQI